MKGAGEPALDRRALAGLARVVLSRGSRLKPAVARIELAAGPAVLKDCADLPGWSRPLARWLMQRELRALARLRGLPGFPQILARVDRDAALLALLPGVPLTGEEFAAAPRHWAALLRERIAAMHARRVFHLDLRQPQNLLVDGQDLNVVDFGAGHAPGLLGWKLLGGVMSWVDRQAVLKYLARYAPQELTATEAKAYLRGLRWRRAWIFSPHRNRGAEAAVRRRLRELQDLSADGGEPPQDPAPQDLDLKP